MELKGSIREYLLKGVLVEVAKGDNSDLTLQTLDIIDHFACLCLSDGETSHCHAISAELAGNLAQQLTGNLFPWCWVQEEVYLTGACPVIPGSLVQPDGQISILF